jgi:hypothetical protein
MSREVQVRFCERRGVRFPPPTLPTKSFFLYDGDYFVDRTGLLGADLALSLDVIYHLIEPSVFETYMTNLFTAGRQYVIVYATNTLITGTAPHVRHRAFSSWVDSNCPQWRLVGEVEGPASGAARADFFVYERAKPERRS